jgi:hypothetical protein
MFVAWLLPLLFCCVGVIVNKGMYMMRDEKCVCVVRFSDFLASLCFLHNMSTTCPILNRESNSSEFELENNPQA